jgi:hypothetical protein
MRFFLASKSGALDCFLVLITQKAIPSSTVQEPHALVADVVDHPRSYQEVSQLDQAPGRERQFMILWPGQGEPLDRSVLGQAEGRRTATGIAGSSAGTPVFSSTHRTIAAWVDSGTARRRRRTLSTNCGSVDSLTA